MKNYFFQRSSNTLTISEFYNNYIKKQYNFNPSYQRTGDVWSDEDKSFLIDTILKNLPMPSIFLRKKLDVTKGETTYEVIDGKQRLTSIISFLNNQIPLPENFGEDRWGDPLYNGIVFSDIPDESVYKEQFWSYELPLVYINEDDDSSIRLVFDRLNRNGEPLTNQELRHAKYSETNLMNAINSLYELPFWKNVLPDIVTVSRMEQYDFLSELFFNVAEGKIFNSTPSNIDELYEKWVDKDEHKLIFEVTNECNKITKYIDDLNLDLKELKINGVSHIYGLWLFAQYVIKNDLKLDVDLKSKLTTLYEDVKNRNFKENPFAEDYKNSMSHSTKSKKQRERRLTSIVNYISN